MTARGPLAAFLLAAALSACGGDDAREAPPAPVRVEVIYASVDPSGPVDGFSLVGEGGKTWPLASQPALDRRVLAADAPGGRYRVVGPAGWAPVGPLEPLALRGDVPPNPLWVGRTHSVYLLHPPELPVTEIEAHRDGRETGPLPFAPRLESGTDGRSALRIAADEWGGAVILQARLGPTHFAKPIRIPLRGDGAPTHATTEPALMTTFDVLALSPDGKPAAGIDVVAVSTIGRLEARATAKTNLEGWARLDPIPVSSERFGLRVGAQAWGGEFRALGEARVLAFVEDGGHALVRFEGMGESSAVQIRPDASDSYALLPPRVPSGKPADYAARLPRGRYWWIASHGGVVASAGPVDVGDSAVFFATEPKPAATLAVHIRGGFITSQDRYDLHARRLESGKEVSVVGGTLRGLLRRDAELSLPPGKWRVRLALGAKESDPKDVDLTTPGTRASIELDAPR